MPNDDLDKQMTAALVAALGDGWAVARRFPRAANESVIAVKGDMRLSVALNMDRVVVHALVPHPNPDYDYQPCFCTVSVARSRGIGPVVDAIHRRLMPEYLPKLEAALAARKAEVARQARVAAALDAMLEATGSRREPGYSPRPWPYSFYHRWQLARVPVEPRRRGGSPAE